MGSAGVNVNEIRLLTGVLELGTSVNVALGSGVFVGLDVGAGVDVLDGIGVGVVIERPGRLQPVNRENSNAKLKIRKRINDYSL